MHPGQLLAQIMREKRLTINDLVKAGLSPRTVSDLLAMNVNRLSADTVTRLCHATGTDAAFWADAQAYYAAPPRANEAVKTSQIFEMAGPVSVRGMRAETARRRK